MIIILLIFLVILVMVDIATIHYQRIKIRKYQDEMNRIYREFSFVEYLKLNKEACITIVVISTLIAICICLILNQAVTSLKELSELPLYL